MIAPTNIKVFHPVKWHKGLHASVPVYLLEDYTRLPFISFLEEGVGRAPFFIPKGTEYKRKGKKYYSATLKRIR